jgi:glycosyltransferase involved in cell wall biosynthesis
VSTELLKAATRLAGAPGRDRVIADGPVAAAALSRLARERPVVYSAHDLESAFRHDVEGSSAGSRRAIERFERNLLGTFVESWMVSRQDTAGARALAPGAQVRYVPAVVDVSAIRPVTAPPGRRRMLYVANFHWPPNRTGLRFLIDEVLPRVWEELPDAHLTIVGRGLSAPPSDDPRIEALGFVDHLGSAYRDADCVVVPLLDGGGVPIKFIEALAYGVPIVATPKAASGLDARAGEHYLEGADGAAFAAAAAGVLRSGAPDVATAARDLAEREYSIEAVSRRITPGAPLD